MTISTIKNVIILCACFLLQGTVVYAQNDTLRLSLNQVFDLALDSREVKLSTAYLTRSETVVEDKKNSRLPAVGFSASAGYLSDVGVLGLGTMPTGFYPMPHFANSYALQASLLLSGGERIQTDIDIAKLDNRMAMLNVQKSSQSVKLILAGHYLDLYQLYQKKKVYEQNILLSKELLEKINNRYRTGVALKSDQIRNELLVSTFELALTRLLNQLQITNNNITTVLALPQNTVILPCDSVEIPDRFTTLLAQTPEEDLKEIALKNNPDNKAAELKKDIADKKLKLVRSFNYPEVSLFLSGALNRPYTFDIPAKDIYANTYQAGIKVNIPLGNLYLSKKKIDIARQDVGIARESQELTEANLIRDVKNNLIKCAEAYQQLQTLYKQQELADENYRRITDNYMEQLALNTEVMDASNQKLDADLHVTEAQIQIAYTYYQLLKTFGQL